MLCEKETGLGKCVAQLGHEGDCIDAGCLPPPSAGLLDPSGPTFAAIMEKLATKVAENERKRIAGLLRIYAGGGLRSRLPTDVANLLAGWIEGGCKDWPRL